MSLSFHYFSWTTNQYKYLSHTINLHFLSEQAHLGSESNAVTQLSSLDAASQEKDTQKSNESLSKGKILSLNKQTNKKSDRKQRKGNQSLTALQGQEEQHRAGVAPSWWRGRGVTWQPLLGETQFVLRAQHFTALANGNQQNWKHPSALVLCFASFHFSPLASPSCYGLKKAWNAMTR